MVFTINELYITKEFKEQASEFFNTQYQILLQDVFNDNDSSISSFLSMLVKSKLSNTMFYEDSNPLTHYYKSLNVASLNDTNINIEVEFFKSRQFQEFIEQIIGFELQLKELSIRAFAHKSYELIHDSKVSSDSYIDVYFFLSNDIFSQEMGGYKVYTTYDEELFYLTPQHNTLICIFRDSELRQYTKYINSLAKDNEYIEIKLIYEISDIENELL